MNITPTRPSVAALHVGGQTLVAPCIWDAPSARAAEAAGARLIATTSAGVSWSLGHPDGQNMTAKDLLHRVEQIAAVTALPLSVDIEEGYSDDPAQVTRLVAQLLDLGVGGINIEDGHQPVALLEEKLRAIAATAQKRRAPIFVNARTDVYLGALVPADDAVSETIARGLRYIAAGCSGVFVPGLKQSDEIEQVTDALPVPVNVMAVPGLPPLEKLTALGVQRLSLGPWLSQVAHAAVIDSVEKLLAAGHDDGFFDCALPFTFLDGGD